MWLRSRCIGALAVLLTSTGTSIYGQPREPVGVIETIACEAQLQTVSQTVVLERDRDVGRVVFAGDKLRCSSAGKIQVALLSKPEEVSSSWFTIPAPKPLDLPGPHEGYQSRNRAALLEYGSRGGRERGLSRPGFLEIYEPARGGTISASSFVVGWSAKAGSSGTILTLFDEGQRELCRVVNGGKSTRLDSFECSKSLERFSRSASSSHSVKLVLQSHGYTEDTEFDVLTPGAERDLMVKLSLDRARDLLSCFRRASTYRSFNMLNATADEYERALEQAPMSTGLLQVTIAAETEINHVDRVRELTGRLPEQLRPPRE